MLLLLLLQTDCSVLRNRRIALVRLCFTCSRRRISLEASVSLCIIVDRLQAKSRQRVGEQSPRKLQDSFDRPDENNPTLNGNGIGFQLLAS